MKLEIGTQLQQDLRYAAMMLLRSPWFSITVVIVLSLAIGVNTAVFSVMEGVLFRALPYKAPDRLCVLWKSIPQRNIDWDWTSAVTIGDWREQTRVFENLALVLRPDGSKATMRTPDGSEVVQGSIVSGNFFDLLGTAPILGRTFSAGESQRGENVTVLSHGFWMRRFGGSPSVLNQEIQLNDRRVAIIGVMPPSFEFPDKSAELWMLLSADPRWPSFQMPRYRIADAFLALGRLKPDRSLSEARAEMSVISSRLAERYPATDTGLNVRVVPVADQIAGHDLRRALWTLGAAALCVLLIACSNIAGLQVARGAARRREFAVRAALGAGRRRLLSQITIEILLLYLAAGIGSLIIAYAALHSLLALAPEDLPRTSGISINAVVLGFSLCLSVITGIAFSLVPAWRITTFEPLSGLNAGGRGSSSGRSLQRLRTVLVATQYAFALVLLTGAGLLIRSFLLLNAVERGFDSARLLTVSVPLPFDKYKQQARGQAFYDEAIRRLEALPGVQGAAVGVTVFSGFRGSAPNQNIVVEGRPFSQDPTLHARNIVSEEYFRLLEIPLREGRTFTTADVAGQPPVAMINETMARRFWPSTSAIGKRFKEVLPGTDVPWTTVVGVVRDVVYSRDGIVIPVFYSPARQWYFAQRELIIRTAADPQSLVAAVRQAVQSIDPSLPRFEIATVADRLVDQDRPRRFQTELLGIFAGLALMLAATGLYGLIAYSTSQRTREFGTRVALGATSGGIVRLVLRQGIVCGVWGLASGVTGAIAFGRALSSSLFGLTATDPATLIAVSSLLMLVMAGASAVPAIRASRVDPTIALRHE